MNEPGPSLLTAGLLAFFLAAVITHPRVFAAGNDASRWAQIEAIVDFGEGAIDRTSFAWTVDRVEVGGKSFSNKPPLLAVAGAGVYAGIRSATPWRLGDPASRWLVVYLVTLVVVGGAATWLAVAMARALGAARGVTPSERRLVLAALLAGTVATSFTSTLNNHTVAAALLFAGWRAALAGHGGRAGLAAGLATGVDFVPGLGLLPVLAWTALGRGGRAAGRRFAAATLGFAAALPALNLALVGSPWPAKMIPGAHDLSASLAPSVAGVLLPESWTYPLEVLFGWHGFFSLSPVLLFGVVGLAVACRRGGPGQARLGVGAGEARALAAALGIQILFHGLFAGSYGGWSYGFRYLIPLVPFLLFFAPLALAGWRRRLFAALLVPSVAIAMLGAFHPWPPAFEQSAGQDPVASLVTNPVGGNLAALLAVRAPESAAARWAAHRFVSPAPAAQRRYFALFFLSRGDPATARRFGPRASR